MEMACRHTQKIGTRKGSKHQWRALRRLFFFFPPRIISAGGCSMGFPLAFTDMILQMSADSWKPSSPFISNFLVLKRWHSSTKLYTVSTPLIFRGRAGRSMSRNDSSTSRSNYSMISSLCCSWRSVDLIISSHLLIKRSDSISLIKSSSL